MRVLPRGAAALALAGLTLAAAPALARQPPDTPPNQAAPGVDSAHAVDPAPDANGPYVGHGEHAFYEVQARIDRVEQRALTQLSGPRRRGALADIRSIKAEMVAQIARHGELRDWDRENLNHRLDRLEAEVGIAPAPPPGE